jgi:pimeloyl-ACP methyl ester carboxylesterase
MPYKLLNYRFKSSNSNNKLKYPVVLLRGLGRSMGFWLDFEEEFSQYCDIIFIDLLGTGGSKNFWGRGSITHFALDVIYTLKMNEVYFFHLSGISLGGMVCLEVAKLVEKDEWKEFHLCSICIMASSSGGMGHKRIHFVPLCLLLLSLLISVLSGTPRHKLFSHYLISQNTLGSHKGIIYKWDSIWRNEYFSHMALIRQLLAAAFYRANMAHVKFKIPFLFIVSKDDKLVPWVNTVSLWEKIPFAELMILENLGHDITTDNPSLIAKILFHFFLRCEDNILIDET